MDQGTGPWTTVLALFFLTTPSGASLEPLGIRCHVGKQEVRPEKSIGANVKGPVCWAQNTLAAIL